MYGVVVVQAEIIASDGGNIVGLARMGVGIVSVEQDALPLEVGDALVHRDLGKVLAGRYGVSKRRSSTTAAGRRATWGWWTDLVFQPDGDEALKGLPGHIVSGCCPDAHHGQSPKQLVEALHVFFWASLHFATSVGWNVPALAGCCPAMGWFCEWGFLGNTLQVSRWTGTPVAVPSQA